MRRWLAEHITRGALGYLVMGLIVLSGAVWSFGALVEIGNVAAKGVAGKVGPLTTLQPPVAGYLFAGSVDLFIFYGYLKCYGPTWQIGLSVFHILAGLATSVAFQLAHAMGHVDPVAVSVVPPIAVALSLDTWVVSQWVDWRKRSKTVEAPEALPPPVPATPAAAADRAGPPPRPRPAAKRSPEHKPERAATGTLTKADRQALYRARNDKQNPAAAVAKVIRDRGLDRSLADATQNGSKP